MSELRMLGEMGDMKISWNIKNEEEIMAAKEIFEKRINEGWSAFRELKTGAKGDTIKIFDPNAERIVLVPPMVGG